MRGGKRNGAALSTLTNRTSRRPVINRRHAPIQAKSHVMIKGRTVALAGGSGYSKFVVSFESFMVNFTGLS
jgi:hypothetical protein